MLKILDKLLQPSLTLGIEHKDEKFELPLTVYESIRRQEGYDPFRDVVTFINTVMSPEEQDSLYKEYKTANWDSLLKNDDIYTVTTLLMERFKTVIALVGYARLRNWVVYNSGIRIPTDTKEDYVDSVDIPGTREQTYLVTDYQDLLTLSLMVRFLIPLWCVYMKPNNGGSADLDGRHIPSVSDLPFKEKNAIMLIFGTELEHSPGFTKLYEYCNATYSSLKNDLALKTVLLQGGMSAEDIPLWLTGFLCMRKLSYLDLRATVNGEPDNLLRRIFSALRLKINPAFKPQIGFVKDKISPDEALTGDDANRVALLESYRVTQRLTVGDIALINFITEDPVRVAKEIAGIDLDLDVYTDFYQTTSKAFLDKPLPLATVTIAKWLITPMMEPAEAAYLGKNSMIRILAICQAVAWQKKELFLALLLGSYSPKKGTVPANSVALEKPSKHLLDALFEKYPVANGQANGKNIVVEAVNQLAISVAERAWIPTAYDSYVNELYKVRSTPTLEVPEYLKSMLVNILINIAGDQQ